MTTHRQHIETITEMISKILNIIAYHLHVFKNNSFLLKNRHLRNLHSLLLSLSIFAAKTVQKDIIFFNCIYIKKLWN
jgi:hypothetical protein